MKTLKQKFVSKVQALNAALKTFPLDGLSQEDINHLVAENVQNTLTELKPGYIVEYDIKQDANGNPEIRFRSTPPPAMPSQE